MHSLSYVHILSPLKSGMADCSVMTLIIKAIIVLMLVFIFFSLGSALFFLVSDKKSDRMIKALTWRVGLSIALFVLLLIAYMLGWISPHPL